MAILVNKIMLSSFILAIIFVTFMVGVESIFEVYEAKVLMTNKLSTPLTLHCKDKTHDDHINTLQPGESHRFKFVPNPFGTASLWFCSAFHRFDIFVQKRDECHDCNWEIYTTGPCKLDPLVKCYPWYS
ncbi:hypothetical protein Lal_00005802 [Lupinus albus]|nr:hypothetical protein Lal_00005802 [Lupinus albus]